ncbi:hypothetical protein [Clostridium pasteurianum]|uniref:Uncharacterized protein n=1 Tax=Clostridium pasteurianum BC1 TaxID=86416 RepID=R4K7J5_CLOPA|nr:hypothetical protein [Clostridium pasteurianum]AGK95605.1 hypothetical protein Clopa_0557 [Clostridium pasteurianum BC1]
MGRLKKIAYPTENNDFIYVPKRIIEHLTKKCIITKQTIVGIGKIVIEYKAKNGSNHGVMELYTMGPDAPKNENKI